MKFKFFEIKMINGINEQSLAIKKTENSQI